MVKMEVDRETQGQSHYHLPVPDLDLSPKFSHSSYLVKGFARLTRETQDGTVKVNS